LVVVWLEGEGRDGVCVGFGGIFVWWGGDRWAGLVAEGCGGGWVGWGGGERGVGVWVSRGVGWGRRRGCVQSWVGGRRGGLWGGAGLGGCVGWVFVGRRLFG